MSSEVFARWKHGIPTLKHERGYRPRAFRLLTRSQHVWTWHPKAGLCRKPAPLHARMRTANSGRHSVTTRQRQTGHREREGERARERERETVRERKQEMKTERERGRPTARDRERERKRETDLGFFHQTFSAVPHLSEMLPDTLNTKVQAHSQAQSPKP